MSKTELKSLLNNSNLLFVVIGSLTLSITSSPVNAQSRALPKAGFNNYSGAALPNAGGLSLQQGDSRPAGAPPQVYNPGEPTLGHKLVHWEAKYMPLRIWISPGKKLTEEPISQINAQRPQEVLALLKADPTFSSLAACSGWTPSLNAAVQSGIEQWREFQNEGLFSFEFVDDPTKANIFVFWTERFVGDEGAGGVSTAGNTVAVLYDANEVRAKEASYGGQLPGTPVIIELRSNNETYDKLQARAAHEFGHALGIKEHSPFNEDLMCVNGIANTLSTSDKATIRWLYKQRPQYVMLPPVLAAGQAAQQAQSQPVQDDYASIRPVHKYRINSGSSSNDDNAAAAAEQSRSSTYRSDRSSNYGSAGNGGEAGRRTNASSSSPSGTMDFLRNLEGSGKLEDDSRKGKKAKNNEEQPTPRKEYQRSSSQSFQASDTASFLKSLESGSKNKEKEEGRKSKERDKPRKNTNNEAAPAATEAIDNNPPAPKASEGY